MHGGSYQIDMCHGPLLRQVIVFSIPLVLSGMLQLLFNTADMIVIGRFASFRDLAAVGATSYLTTLLINLFMGLSVGTNVLVARYYGAHEGDLVSRAVHTSVMVSLMGGLLLALVGWLLARPLLQLMDTPEDVLDKASLYMWIYFGGMPVIMLYNFGSAVLRAVGDTRRPLYFLVLGGVINVLLNLFFVIVLHWDVAGVAVATVIAQAIAALLILRCLRGAHDSTRLFWRQLKLTPSILKQMLWIGLPAGVQGMFFSMSNMVIQSAVNAFGSMAVAGNAASSCLGSFVNVGSSVYHQTAVSFVSQNVGGRNYGRIVRSIGYCTACSVVFGLVSGSLIFFNGRFLLGVYNQNPEVIGWGLQRMRVMFLTYFLCGIMDVLTGALRGLGHSLEPAVVTFLGSCALRVVWVYTVFRVYPTLTVLLASYPISWIVTGLVNGLFLWHICRRLLRSWKAEKAGE